MSRRLSSVRSAVVALVAVVIAASGVAVTMRPASADVVPMSANTDAALTALNNAFLVSNGNQRYYKESLGKTDKDYFWRQALDIQAVEDVYESTGRAETRDLIGRLLDTFLQQNQGNGGLYDWNWNQFNDDLLWAGLAFVRGYRITGNATYLSQAQYAFNRAYDRGWDTALGGGLWWSIEKTKKSALSNSPAVILGSLIYEAGGNRAYLDKARAIYDWTWSRLLDRNTGGVHEQMNADGSLEPGQTVYSAGAFVGAAQAMYRDYRGQSLFDDAKRTTDFVIRERTTNGIMTNGQREGTWQSEFARGMGEFVRQNNLWAQYYTFMKRNADAAWNVRRTDLNLTWNRWDAQTPRDDTRAVETIGAVIMQAVTPASIPSTNTISSTWNGRCVDVPNVNYSDGQPLDVWSCNGGGNQKWESVNGAFRTQNNMCLDVAGGSTADGAVIQIATCSGGAAQQFVLDAAGQLVNPRSNKCVDIKAWTDRDGAGLDLWTCNGGANQKWRRG
ncbi:glycoside hydrolase family 76 protein [Actinoplanes sp. NPDC049265]|uniref:glycoside hydrolase family 76 protein n=1 Tax=Actinoplanes sp. NPDC049265 TaxID=3363902 RepID=UPI003721A968